MKIALLIVLSLTAVVALVVAIGALLPRWHVASRTVRLRQPPEAVWGVMTDFRAQAAWRSDLTRVERGSDREGREVWNEVRKDGSTIPLETLEATVPVRLVRRIADASLPFGGTWEYELVPDGDGCRLTITERGEVYNPIFRLISRFFDPRATIDVYLKALGARLGTEVTLE